MGKKKKSGARHVSASQASKAKKNSKKESRDAQTTLRAEAEQRRSRKLARRKDKNFAELWAQPTPADLVGRLERPNVKHKYQTYFEFAENTERKDKKLEFQVTSNRNPPPGFTFVPIGDPTLTNACKEISRERDAMIFIVSEAKEENNRISDHVFRSGFHFREIIVDEAREVLGQTAASYKVCSHNRVDNIPESQEEINEQADAAIRDLFPRIPNTDRQMIIDHAFQKGVLFHGEPTVGLQPDLTLSRRVQLAVLAHIRHTHTRYDLLLKETSWANARKVVEPVCLDVLVKWRGDEETGRDQMEEILREVVIITDSEESDDDSEDEGSSNDEASSGSDGVSVASSRNHSVPVQLRYKVFPNGNLPKDNPTTLDGRRAQRGFSRYRYAWEQAVRRQKENPIIPEVTDFHSQPSITKSYFIVPERGRHSSELTQPQQLDCVIYDDRPHYHSPRGRDSRTLSASQIAKFDNSGNRGIRLKFKNHAASRHALHYGVASIETSVSPRNSIAQDLLVPSIETASSEAAPVPLHFDRLNGSRVEPQLHQSSRYHEEPAKLHTRRQVIVVDDSPRFDPRHIDHNPSRMNTEASTTRDRGFPLLETQAQQFSIPANAIYSKQENLHSGTVRADLAWHSHGNVYPTSRESPTKQHVSVFERPVAQASLRRDPYRSEDSCLIVGPAPHELYSSPAKNAYNRRYRQDQIEVAPSSSVQVSDFNSRAPQSARYIQLKQPHEFRAENSYFASRSSHIFDKESDVPSYELRSHYPRLSSTSRHSENDFIIISERSHPHIVHQNTVSSRRPH